MLPLALREVKKVILNLTNPPYFGKAHWVSLIIYLHTCLEFALQIESAAVRSFPNLEQGETKEIPSAVDEDTKTSAFGVPDDPTHVVK